MAVLCSHESPLRGDHLWYIPWYHLIMRNGMLVFLLRCPRIASQRRERQAGLFFLWEFTQMFFRRLLFLHGQTCNGQTQTQRERQKKVVLKKCNVVGSFRERNALGSVKQTSSTHDAQPHYKMQDKEQGGVESSRNRWVNYGAETTSPSAYC